MKAEGEVDGQVRRRNDTVLANKKQKKLYGTKLSSLKNILNKTIL
ncbi:hypothetical protein JEHA107958_00010 [Jeotgalicoccus halotolerans]|uniref:Uncharacterized protein n=1 Tax=Jeotgalicoccus halotolerans TaxID=157227 RepID=A0A3E0AZS2_9STAP|nr:hypothetical protein DFR63_0251 [Jeotgalicoccus halotolerans]